MTTANLTKFQLQAWEIFTDRFGMEKGIEVLGMIDNDGLTIGEAMLKVGGGQGEIDTR